MITNRYRNKFTKKIVCTITAVIMLVLAYIGVLVFFDDNISSSNAMNYQSSISITNSDFASSPDDEFPFSPTGYTSSAEPDNSDDPSGVTAGVIDTSEEQYAQYDSPTLNDDYVLMINSNNRPDQFSYTTNDSIELSANSYYTISVLVYTPTETGEAHRIANLYLLDADNDDAEYASITNIASNGWNTYTFFIATGLDDINVKIRMSLDGNGIALFDTLSAFELNENTFTDRMNLQKAGTYTYKSEVENMVSEMTMSDDTFSLSTFDPNNQNFADGIINANTNTDATDGRNDSAFKLSISEDNATFVEFSTSDDYLTLEQNNVYKIEINAKVKDISGNASIKLVRTDSDLNGNEDEVSERSLSISSDTGEDGNLMNDYETFTFYVRSHPLMDTNFKLVVSMGESPTSDTEAETASGELYINTIRVSKVAYSYYSNASTGDNVQKLDLASNFTYDSDNEYYFTNGNFNDIQIDNVTNQYPALPANWTQGSEGDYTNSGVINTGTEEFNKISSNLRSIRNPLNPYKNNATYDNNNVLMLYNASNNTIEYTSSTKDPTANSYYRISLYVQTQYAPMDISIVSTLNSNEVVLATKTVETNIQEWKQITFYIFTGDRDLSVSVRATLDSENTAAGFIDDVAFLALEWTSDDFANISGENITKVDLSNLMAATGTGLSKPSYFTFDGNDNNYYLVDSTDSSVIRQVVASPENYEAFRSFSGENRNVLMIRTLDDAYYTLTSSLGFDLTSGNYYRISVSVYTQNLEIKDTSVDQELLGASVGLSGFDDYFSEVVSNNRWTTYTFYISPNEDVTTYIELSLGSSSAKVSGDVFFANIEFADETENFTEETFANLSNNYNTKILRETATDTDDSESDNSETTTNDNSFDPSTLFYYISSIIFALAIVIAIVGVLIKKVKWKKPRKKTKNSYDRKSTLSKQYYSRQASIQREQQVRELSDEISEMKKEREDYETKYKQDLSNLRQMKLHRADQSEINKLEKEMKKQQKMSSTIGLNISKMESQLEYLKSEQYLNSLAKKLERERVFSTDTESDEDVDPKDNISDVNVDEQNTTATEQTDIKPTKKRSKKEKRDE